MTLHWIMMLAGWATPVPAPAPATPVWQAVQPAAVCRMSGTWVIGLGGPRASVTNINVESIELNGRQLFQALHRGVMSSATGDDQFLVDATTLHPVSTRHSGPVPPVHFRFDGMSAEKLAPDGTVQERITLSDIALPEGPAMEIIVQALPWRDGLRLTGTMLDRWRGTGAARNRQISWTVEGRETRQTLSGLHDVFRTRLAPDDGSFHIMQYITVARPHHVVRTEYIAGPGGVPRVSEMREAAFHCGTLPAERIKP